MNHRQPPWPPRWYTQRSDNGLMAFAALALVTLLLPFILLWLLFIAVPILLRCAWFVLECWWLTVTTIARAAMKVLRRK